MKTGSEYKVNLVERIVKKPFSRFGILTRFRVSIAFNSLSRLFVLCLATTLTISSIAFAFANVGKFEQAETSTFTSRNYKYAVDLYTPTAQGGQYIPTPDTDYGDSGLLDVNDEFGNGTNQHPTFVPGSYYTSNPSGGTSTVSTGYQQVYKNSSDASIFDITKRYYQQKTAGLFGPTINNLDSLEDGKGLEQQGTFFHQNLIYPMAPDSVGQYGDIQYLKNKFLDKNCMNFVVGIGSATTNPWDLATGLMPENQANLVNSKDQFLLNCAG
jgi:putative ABC transport system permease protein